VAKPCKGDTEAIRLRVIAPLQGRNQTNGTVPRAMPWDVLFWPFRPHIESENVSLRAASTIKNVPTAPFGSSVMPNSMFYHGPGVVLELHRVQAAVWLTLALDGGTCPDARAATVEFLIRPVDERGLARGGAIPVCRQTVPLVLVQSSQKLCGRAWLPATLEQAVIDRCHIRVVPGRMERDSP
jgi:hypothetical protein